MQRLVDVSDHVNEEAHLAGPVKLRGLGARDGLERLVDLPRVCRDGYKFGDVEVNRGADDGNCPGCEGEALLE